MTKTKLVKLHERVDEIDRKISLYQGWFNNPNVTNRITEAWILTRCGPELHKNPASFNVAPDH